MVISRKEIPGADPGSTSLLDIAYWHMDTTGMVHRVVVYGVPW